MTGSSPDPYVDDLADLLDEKYGPGYVKEVNKVIYNADGSKLAEVGIVTDNAIIEVKSSGGTLPDLRKKDRLLQEMESGNVVGYEADLQTPVDLSGKKLIGYSPKLGREGLRQIANEGYEATNDYQALVDMAGP